MKLNTAITIISWLAVLAYSVLLYAWYVIVGTTGIGSLLLIICLVASLGLLTRQEWARKMLIVANAGLIIFNLADIIFISRIFDPMAVTEMSWCVVMIATFMRPSVCKLFHRRFPHRRRKIVLIDDDPTFLHLVQHNLAAENMIVLTAETGERGMALAATESPDLILLDIILPGLKGREVCDQLKEDTRTSEIPVVFLTHKDSPDDMKAAMEGGAVAYLTKPVNFKELTATIEKVLGY